MFAGAMSIWRQVRAAVLLPGVVTIPIPALILITGGTDIGWGWTRPWAGLPVLFGAALILLGLRLWYATVRLFAREGEGTLAPWDPTRKLVVRGPYRYVRNPMIVGVLLALVGEAALFGSVWIVVWAAAFLAVNMVWFPLVEEPGLVERFGPDYDEYRRHVPRWVPRRTPWTGTRTD
jgi:protein-S-isoprenylcysteine O-methyltransferase Ste14